MNILKKADEIVNDESEDKIRQYGKFDVCMERASVIASVMTTKHITPEDMYLILAALKFAREANAHKEDNLLDAVAYIGGLNNYIINKNKKNENSKDKGCKDS